MGCWGVRCRLVIAGALLARREVSWGKVRSSEADLKRGVVGRDVRFVRHCDSEGWVRR